MSEDHCEEMVPKSLLFGLFQEATDAIVCLDESGLVTFWNSAAETSFGYSSSQTPAISLADIVLEGDVLDGPRWVGSGRVENVTYSGPSRLWARRRDGVTFPIEASTARWQDRGKTSTAIVMRDLSSDWRSRAFGHHLAFVDELTELPTRALFIERLDDVLRSKQAVAMLKIGLDQFMAINGTVGAKAGDLVLVHAAQRIVEIADTGSFVARIGGDEFGIIMGNCDEPDAATLLARRVIERLSEPFQIGRATCHLSASVGIVSYPDPIITTTDDILKGALLALQQAKKAGGRRFEVFRPHLWRQADDRRRLDDELRCAFVQGEFELYFQPQVNIRDGRLIGAEALIRWHHPSRGLLTPADFLASLERSAIVLEVGRWILNEACAFAAAMATVGVEMQIGVNLFAAQLQDPRLHDNVMEALGMAGLPSHLLEIEITETTVLDLDETLIGELRRLRSKGIKIAFDDYGTGFASLSVLKRYPLTRLKIDREFICNIDHSSENSAITRAIVALGSSLNLSVIAEGVETEEQVEILKAYGCEEAQGYLFARPMTASSFLDMYTDAKPARRDPARSGETGAPMPRAVSRRA